MTYSTGWSCPWFGGAKLDDGEACRLRRLSAARAHVMEVQGGPPVSPMLRVCHHCRADIQVPATDTYRGTGTDSRPSSTQENEEGNMSNPKGPYQPGTCTECGQERNVFKKSGVCQPCTMKAYKSEKKSPPIVAPSKAKKPAKTSPAIDEPRVAIDNQPGSGPAIVVDLAAVPGLLPAMQERAREELRSLEMQALFILREAVKGKVER